MRAPIAPRTSSAEKTTMAAKKGAKPKRCPYCGLRCDGPTCAQHRDLAKIEREATSDRPR